MKILVIDIGGSHVKVLATGQKESRKAPSGQDLTPPMMVAKVKELAGDWEYEAVSIGFPGLVGARGPMAEPVNLGEGWVGFDFREAFGCPVKILNDAAMQALGSYEGRRMLFLGLGTSVGSALITDQVIVPFEIGQLPYRDGDLEDSLGKEGLERLGQAEWQRVVEEVVPILKSAFIADYVVLGGGNGPKVDPLPEGARHGDNENAFEGGFRLWETTVVHPEEPPTNDVWRVLG
ncbi:MAG: ROK family protein [Planctomycetes bacterium]|nr:ROK family protein [Planctomycetota bacterium]